MLPVLKALKIIAAALMQAFAGTDTESKADHCVTDQEIIEAVRTENVQTINQYLQRACNVSRMISARGLSFSPLHQACELGRERVVEIFLNAQADVNIQRNDGSSPLYLASQNGHQQIAGTLIKAQADVNLQTNTGESPLYIGSRNGHWQIVELLIKAQADINAQEVDGCSPLYIASQNGHQQIADSLIAEGADVNLRGVDRMSPLYIASQKGHHHVVDSLIKAQADVNIREIDGCSPLYIASQNDHQQVVSLLIKAQADLNPQQVDGSSPLIISSQQGHQKILDLLIKSGADVNLQRNTGSSPIHIASLNGLQRAVESLIKAQADVNLQNYKGESPLYVASQNGHPQVVDLLIRSQAHVCLPRSDGSSPLHIASLHGHQQIVASLVKAQADVNAQESDGSTPVYNASLYNHQQVLVSLIEAHANVNLQEMEGCSPLYVASQDGHQHIVAFLIKAKAEVDLQKNNGFSPLHIASQEGHHNIVDALINAQANVNIQGSTGESALYIASQEGHQQVVDSLIKAGADVDSQENVYGCTPLYIASLMGHQGIVSSLIKAQADVNLQTSTGATPLSIALLHGHHEVVDILVKAQADVSVWTNSGDEARLYVDSMHDCQETGDSPLIRAQTDDNHEGCRYSLDVENQCFYPVELHRIEQSNGCAFKTTRRRSSPDNEFHYAHIDLATTGDSELSQQLHLALSESGFVESRAALQSAVSDVLQEILRKRLDIAFVFVVGSYSEGWGNNLTTLDGRTDIKSDIDVMTLIQGQLFHPRGLCDCGGLKILHDYSNGHIQYPGFASNPALPYHGSALKPAVDIVFAGQLCCYPPIAPLQPNRVSKSNIPQRVLQSLQCEVASNDSSPCHVVHAASHGREGQEVRVSTNLLEKRILRSLTTLQGQLFVTLKYLVKKVICHKDGFNLEGLKPYHVKTITFRMVEETPTEQWNSGNLVNLTRRSLQMLLDYVESSRTADNAHGRVMKHFFLSDADLYLKCVVQKDRSMDQTLSGIASTLRTVIGQLPQLLLQFMSRLKPASDSGRFYFHPFQILPDLSPRSLPKSNSIEYHEIYDVVRESLVRLSFGDCSTQSQEFLTQLIARLPDCAFSAREALRALACLKFGYRKTAEKVVSQCRGHSVSRGIAWSTERSATEATTEFVWRQLKSQDSAWKFSFEFDQRPKLPLLTGALAECFPLQLKNNTKYFYLNFEALLWALRLQLETDSEVTAQVWIRDATKREDVDEQVLQVAVLLASDFDVAISVLAKLKKVHGASCIALIDELMKKWQL